MQSDEAEQVFHNLRDLVSPNNLPNDVAALHIRAMALISRLKALHRASNATTRIRKEATAEARQDMDQSHLVLQNLLYEKRHLEREIEKCRQFALEDFSRLAPEAARTEAVLLDEHQLMLNRLSFELAERQRYSAKSALDLRRKELLQIKEDLLKESKTKATTMDSVKTQIDQLIKSATDTRKKIEVFVPSIPNTDDAKAPG
ncbi:hypothetical protein H0H93_002374 [Arthromyces matolae]|nr:hypothetical protein H0H93_002374 [Arthromyces matolae]